MTDPEPIPADRPRRTGRRLAIALGAGAALLLVGYGAAVATVSGDDVPEGTTVNGVDIGGMSSDAAVAALTDQLGDSADDPIPVVAGKASTELVPAEAGLAVDWSATVDQVVGKVLDPRELFRRLRGDVAIEPVTTTDDKALTASLETLAEVAVVEAEEPRIRYKKGPAAALTEGVPGTALNVPAASSVVAAAYMRQPYDTVTLPMDTIAPTVSDEEARRVLTELAEPAVALPVTLAVSAKAAASASPSEDDGEQAEPAEVKVSAKAIADALTFSAEKGTLAASLDGEALHDQLDGKLAEIERPGRDARIVISDGKPSIVKSRTGLAVDPDALSEATLAVLPKTTAADRVAVVTLTSSQPDFTTKDAKALGIKEKLSSFRQWFPPAAYRWQNVGQAAEYLNGTILEPGDTFSMNKTIKERTAANGYTEGFIIQGGRFREELGGGVSIITTATWTAGFYAGLERVEQHPHGLYISRYKAGLEATVAYGLLDLRMRNDTGHGVLITAKRFSDGVLIEMWGTKKFDKVTSSFTNRYAFTDYQTITDDGAKCVPSEGVRGFSIAVTRRRYIDGKAVSTETWPTTYKPTPHVQCTNPSASRG